MPESTTEKKTQHRNGVLIGGYLHPDLADYMQQRGKREYKSITVLLTEMIVKEMKENPINLKKADE